jgi:hypothetical protein
VRSRLRLPTWSPYHRSNWSLSSPSSSKTTNQLTSVQGKIYHGENSDAIENQGTLSIDEDGNCVSWNKIRKLTKAHQDEIPVQILDIRLKIFPCQPKQAGMLTQKEVALPEGFRGNNILLNARSLAEARGTDISKDQFSVHGPVEAEKNRRNGYLTVLLVYLAGFLFSLFLELVLRSDPQPHPVSRNSLKVYNSELRTKKLSASSQRNNESQVCLFLDECGISTTSPHLESLSSIKLKEVELPEGFRGNNILLNVACSHNWSLWCPGSNRRSLQL